MIERLFRLLALATVCLGVVSVPAFSLDDRTFCSLAEQLAETENAGGVRMVDAVTRFDVVVVLCELKLVDYKKFVSVRMSNLEIGWKSKRQAKWNEGICKLAHLPELISHGWTISETTTFKDGRRNVIKAKCK